MLDRLSPAIFAFVSVLFLAATPTSICRAGAPKAFDRYTSARPTKLLVTDKVYLKRHGIHFYRPDLAPPAREVIRYPIELSVDHGAIREFPALLAPGRL